MVSLITVAYQVRSNRKQARDTHRAELVASAFFDLLGGWALNRRAQIEPVDQELLRTSAAQFYTAAFRLSALVEGETLQALERFMRGGLGDKDERDDSMQALWQLHNTVTEFLGYRSPSHRDELVRMFWLSGRNVPRILSARSSRHRSPNSWSPNRTHEQRWLPSPG
ncbi:hypothetical protein [Nocardia transvalensis]|uniref:hypothetical protein n=1 Tax=Nocardia transvalensis TaxID=37333 RepID=UPI0018931122|nr:hypothetical protein [Nocardia transvalensis]MBF6328141.1 hypothetical protein [Nocardia transvalensis]